MSMLDALGLSTQTIVAASADWQPQPLDQAPRGQRIGFLESLLHKGRNFLRELQARPTARDESLLLNAIHIMTRAASSDALEPALQKLATALVFRGLHTDFHHTVLEASRGLWELAQKKPESFSPALMVKLDHWLTTFNPQNHPWNRRYSLFSATDTLDFLELNTHEEAALKEPLLTGHHRELAMARANVRASLRHLGYRTHTGAIIHRMH